MGCEWLGDRLEWTLFFSNSCRVALQSPPRMTPRKIDGTVFFNRFSCLPLSILDLCDMPPAMLMYVFSSVSSVVPLGGQLGRPRRGRGSSAEERRLAPLPGAHRVQHQPSHPHHWHAVAELAQGALVAPPVHHAGQVGGAAWRPVYAFNFIFVYWPLAVLPSYIRLGLCHVGAYEACSSVLALRSSRQVPLVGGVWREALHGRPERLPQAAQGAGAVPAPAHEEGRREVAARQGGGRSRGVTGGWERSRSRCPTRWGVLRGGNGGVGEVEKLLPAMVGGALEGIGRHSAGVIGESLCRGGRVRYGTVRVTLWVRTGDFREGEQDVGVGRARASGAMFAPSSHGDVWFYRWSRFYELKWRRRRSSITSTYDCSEQCPIVSVAHVLIQTGLDKESCWGRYPYSRFCGRTGRSVGSELHRAVGRGFDPR